MTNVFKTNGWPMLLILAEADALKTSGPRIRRNSGAPDALVLSMQSAKEFQGMRRIRRALEHPGSKAVCHTHDIKTQDQKPSLTLMIQRL